MRTDCKEVQWITYYSSHVNNWIASKWNTSVINMFPIPKTRLGAPHVLLWTSKQQNICSSANSYCMHQKLQAVNTSLVPWNSFSKNVLTWRKASRNWQWFSVKYFSSCGTDGSGNKQNRRGRSTVCRLSVSDHLPRSSPPWRVLFFGTDHFSLKMLKTLNENRYAFIPHICSQLHLLLPKLPWRES